MRRLSFIIFVFVFSLSLSAQISPHGDKLQIDCGECHSTGGWKKNLLTNTFDHSKTAFSLLGKHNQIDCKVCHVSLTFSDEKGQTDCASCHLDVHQQTLGNDCASCHTSQSWFVGDVNKIHLNSRFPLIGVHANSDCFDCHLTENLLQFRPLGIECIDCHRTEYLSTTSPNHQQLGYSTDCLECHNMLSADWTSSSFEHDFFPLTEGHAVDDCFACHNTGSYESQSPDCETCHMDDYNAAVNPPHASLNFSLNCEDCHTTFPGWAPARFDIHNDYYILEGAHASIANECVECHTGGYVNTPNTCYGCHAEDYNLADNPAHVNGVFSTDCIECHSQNDWEPATFEIHNDFYVLEGAHASIANECAICHQGDYSSVPNTCYGCHAEEYNGVSDPSHLSANFSTDCTQCHSQSAWIPSTFDHNDIYILEGAHAAIANECAECHTGDYANTPNTCYGCHAEEYNSVADPSHLIANFSTDCTQCHSQSVWEPSTFDHNDIYILEGAHAALANECGVCHTGDYANTPNACYDCHAEEYNGVADPSHLSASFSTDCTDCHSQSAWEPSTFDHNDIYILEGAHAAIANECAECHTGDYANTPNTCYGCHAEEYNGVVDPSHLSANFSTDCTQCHSQSAWEPSTFDHNDIYILEGAHAAIANECAICHQGDYTNTPSTCYDCHAEEYNGVADPSHLSANFSTDCTECHSQSAWIPSTFDHNDIYILEGAHASIANECAICHQGDYSSVPSTCYGCHSEEYIGVAGPSHLTLNFPTGCSECHSQSAWEPATFEIHNDFYVLEGAHATIANECAICHQGDYTNTPNTCYGCHSSDYNGVLDPPHLSSNFSTDCTECHLQSVWVPSTFDHNNIYVLEGAHASIANECFVCHQGDYTNTPNTCYGCHADDYNSTSDPSHLAANFPTDCLECHSQTAWEPSTFDHDGQYFPIYSGEHQGEWNSCVDCHTVATNYALFSCIVCHEHNQTDMDDEHSDVNDYVYNSVSCLDCHPNGEADK